MTRADLTGTAFGRLTVRAQSGMAIGRRYRWLCDCACGKTTVVVGQNLKNGHTTSCGCFRSDATSANKRTHGKRQSTEYGIWIGMRNRCENPRSDFYKHYGARGICVCDAWMDFQKFYDDMGQRHSNKHSIDRIDPNGNYEAANCRWATSTQQNRNRRNNVLFEHKGKRATLAELCELTGVKRTTAYARLQRGCSLETALSNDKNVPNPLATRRVA